jgi:hypothetical protein
MRVTKPETLALTFCMERSALRDGRGEYNSSFNV